MNRTHSWLTLSAGAFLVIGCYDQTVTAPSPMLQPAVHRASEMAAGFVRDSATGRPLEGASVTVVRSPGDQTRGIGAGTNGQGEFRLSALEPGRYVLLVRRIGFRARRVELSVPGPVLSVALTPAASTRCVFITAPAATAPDNTRPAP